MVFLQQSIVPFPDAQDIFNGVTFKKEKIIIQWFANFHKRKQLIQHQCCMASLDYGRLSAIPQKGPQCCINRVNQWQSISVKFLGFF